ncbi:MAG: ABC transporter permease [Streptomyces sp.]|nr:ABC transporter permease [Streptomyces sp.]
MRAELRLAWLLTRGSDRREWWRVALTAVGAALATGIGFAIVVLTSLDGYYSVSIGSGLLDSTSDRRNVSVALGLLLIPVLGFVGQCARIGAVHRDRRLAALRLAGAAPWQVRRIAALESGLACLAGSVLGTVTAVGGLQLLWSHRAPAIWVGFALITLAVPVLGAAVSALSLRRVVASPLGRVRRAGLVRAPGRLFRTVTWLLAAATLFLVVAPVFSDSYHFGPVTVFVPALLLSLTAVWLTGSASRQLGEGLAARTRRPAVLIAAERLRDDPWAAARTHAGVLLVTVAGSGFVGVRQIFLAEVHAMSRKGSLAADPAYYTTGIDLTAAAILVGLALVLTALAVGTAESLATRRRGLAAQVAAGVPQTVLARALLLETALPLAPAVAVAGMGGFTIGTWYASITSDVIVAPVPYVPLLVPLAVYGACLLAAACSLPLLRRSVRPAELRYA